MNPQRWERIDEIFFAAQELDPSQRDAYLAAVDDAELRAEVEDLLARANTGNRSLRQIVPKAMEAMYAGQAPETIGPWRVLRELGAGGMGQVYLAERRDGEFQQTVAIKVIRPGFEVQEIASRFRQERQMMANLNHPNIARVFDGGATADRRPYFVMEYVEGLPVTEWLRTHEGGMAETLRVFVDLCAAVDHAHRRLIVHRDIKPGNILVTAEGVVKLLDFGIAKVLDPADRRGPHSHRYGGADAALRQSGAGER